MEKTKPNQKSIIIKGTIIGTIITIPSIAVFFTSWYILGDKIMALIIGGIVHFVGMGFSVKLSKRLFKVNI